jgi:hypothetical protein
LLYIADNTFHARQVYFDTIYDDFIALQYIAILTARSEKLDASYFHQYNLLKNDYIVQIIHIHFLCEDYIYPFQYQIES